MVIGNVTFRDMADQDLINCCKMHRLPKSGIRTRATQELVGRGHVLVGLRERFSLAGRIM